MRILLLTPHYPPEIRSVSVLMSELAEDLVSAGHDVTVLAPYPPDNMAEASGSTAGEQEACRGVHVVRVAALPFVKVAPTVRAVTHFTLAASMIAAGRRQGRHDVTMAYSPPLTLALACEILGRCWGAPYVLNVQDLYPQALIDLGLARSRIVVGVLRWLERRAYRHAAAITVHSQGNRALVAARGVPEAKITVIPNPSSTLASTPCA
jgi:glycosyltransferase involved in cell wall biosynthesis